MHRPTSASHRCKSHFGYKDPLLLKAMMVARARSVLRGPHRPMRPVSFSEMCAWKYKRGLSCHKCGQKVISTRVCAATLYANGIASESRYPRSVGSDDEDEDDDEYGVLQGVPNEVANWDDSGWIDSSTQEPLSEIFLIDNGMRE